jgi:hypothetical protein
MTQSNIIVKIPQIGDGVFLDPQGKPVFVKCDTIDIAGLSGYTKVGVVYNREGNEIDILALDAPSHKWEAAMIYKVNGIKLDGTANTFQIRVGYGSSQLYTDYTSFSWSGTDVADFASALSTHLEANHDGSGVIPRCRAYGDEVWIQLENYTNWTNNVGVTGSNGVSVVQNAMLDNYLPYGSNAVTKGAFTFGFPAANKWSYLGRAYANGRTPTTQESIKSTVQEPVTPDAFTNSEYCSDLHETFGTFDNYIESRTLLCPASRNVGAARNGHKWTQMLKDYVWTNRNGVTAPLFPAHKYCADYGKGNGIFGAGNWHLMDVPEMYNLMRQCRYCTNTAWINTSNGNLTNNRANADAVNRTLLAMGASSSVNVAGYRWSSGRNSKSYGWMWVGSSGYLRYNYSFDNSFSVCPSLHLNLSKI